MTEQEMPDVSQLEPAVNPVPPPPPPVDYIPTVPPAPPPIAVPFTSVDPAMCPPDLARKWNWGAFLLTPFWLGAMRLWNYFIGFIVIMVGLTILGVLVHTLDHLTNIASFVFGIVIARQGNRLAWQSRNWRDEAEFRAVQRTWGIWGGILTGVALLLVVLVVLVVVLISQQSVPGE